MLRDSFLIMFCGFLVNGKLECDQRSSGISRDIRECSLLEVVICRLLTLREKTLRSGFNATPSKRRPQDAMVDFIPNTTLGITKLYIAIKTASWTLL